MNNFYIYKFDFKENKKSISATVIFCDREDINTDILQSEIKRFYELHFQTDKIYILGPAYLESKLTEIFIDNIDKTFKGIPKRQETSLAEGIYIALYNKDGKIINKETLSKGFIKSFLNEGLQQIFIKRGGLVSTDGAHHFVFPSRKHCDKFLRTGNILLFSSEIFYVAFALLKHFDEDVHTQIYCDTSSINSIAFALIELKNRFFKDNDKKQIPIESFSSYNGLYKNELSYSSNALLLISASTSANIIGYILDKHRLIERSNILILFYLGEESKFLNIKEQVICNLTMSDENLNGVPFYQTFVEGKCELCNKGSYPVEVSGDVFLLEKPQINRIMIGLTDSENYLSDFVKHFKSVKKKQNILKVNYKESSNSKYEIYIDFNEVLNGLSNGKFENFNNKLNDFINQFIPSNTKKIITLNDSGSQQLGNIILEKISSNYKIRMLPDIISQDEISTIDSDCEGSVIVVGSCISNGKNLLYISRALRRCHKIRIVYFIGISRTKNSKYLAQLKSNLKQGIYGLETNSFHEIETIFCNNDSVNTSWLKEIDFLSEFISFINDKSDAVFAEVIDFLEERKSILLKSMGDTERGLSNNLFYPRFLTSKIEQLDIRRNFAFFNFHEYVNDVSQADIYFTISNIINTLRNNELKAPKSDKQLKSLVQSTFVRNLLDPGNFDRFNDGIIQASILRAAKPEELAYHIDPELSLEMFGTFQTLIKYHNQEQGEALVEFLYALAYEKLSLTKSHLKDIIFQIREKCLEKIFHCFADYIEYKIFSEPEDKKKEWEKKLLKG